MAVFLLILKIIGITLLVILGLLLLIILTVLFVPVRYMASGNKDREEGSDICAAATVSWLLKIVKVVFYFNGHNTSLRIRVFGISLKTREEKEEAARKKRLKKENRQKKKEEKRNRKKKEPEYTMLEYDEASDSIKQEKVDLRGSELTVSYNSEDHLKSGDDTENNKDTGHYVPDNTDDKKEKISPIKRIYTIYDRIRDLVSRLIKKISDIIAGIGEKIDNFEYYYDALINDARNREAVKLIIKKAKLLLRSVRPRKLRGHLDYGSEDPADTGRLLAAAAVMYPLYGGRFLINPDFENRVLAFDIMLKGRVYIFVLVRVAVALYFNKKVKRLIRIIKKENSNGR